MMHIIDGRVGATVCQALAPYSDKFGASDAGESDSRIGSLVQLWWKSGLFQVLSATYDQDGLVF